MKYFFIFFLSSFFIFTLSAQNSDDFFKSIPIIDQSTPEWAKLMYSSNPNVAKVEDFYRAFYEKNKFVKNLHTQNHKHWIRQVEPLLNEKGFIQQPTAAQQDQMYKRLKVNYANQQQSSIPGSGQGWVPMGPFETFKANTTKAISWHKNIYSIDQSSSDPSVLICGTEAGGVYKTINKGANWTLISKGEVFSGGNSAVKIHPTNSDRFLVASNQRIYQSNNGGVTWTVRHTTGGSGNEFQYSPNDTNLIFHTSTTGLFKSTNGGSTWAQVYTQKCWDIDFHPTNSSIVYLLKSNATAKKTEFYRSTNSGTSWNLVTSGWYNPALLSQAIESGGKIAVTPSAPDIVYVCLIGASKSNDSGWIGIYKSSDEGLNWTNPSGQDGSPYSSINDTLDWNVAAYSNGVQQGFFNFDLEASPFDSNKIWVGTVRLSESLDGGKTFKSIGAANSTRLTDFHADVQDIEIHGNDIWVATDGGVNYSNNALNTHVALNNGIQAAAFWGFNSGWNNDSYTGGKYHDGTSGWYEGYGLGKAYNIGGVEEATGYVHPIESRKMIFRTHSSSKNSQVHTIPRLFGGQVEIGKPFPIRPNEHFNGAERSGFYFDPRYANHIYVALNNVVYKSVDGGLKFDSLYAFPNPAGLVYEMEISRSNPNVIYAVYNANGGYLDPCELWKSSNAGKTWTKSATPSGNNRRIRLSIQPDNADKVWICIPRGTTGSKVFYSGNGGTSWVNKTTSVIATESVSDIYYQSGNNDMVYLTTRNGVFHWNKSTNNWINYSFGLPLVAKTLQINPFYKEGELRLASKGRGIWARKMKDTSFAPVAQPITYADSLYCSRDTAFFDCYSILKHQGASWKWSFSPLPDYISDSNVRNPKVIFGKSGSYDVTLEITDGNNKKSNKTINNMVTVLNLCEPDTVPGYALDCNTNSSYASIPDLNANQVDSFTMSAWIMPRSLQKNLSAILMNDNDAAGLNFYHSSRQPNLQLGYHWKGGQWSWSSGLSVDSMEWSHVAIVATPTGITIYVNGVASRHNRTLSKVDISSLKVGSYKGWSSRNFNGLIDEVCLWDRALSQEEIRETRHLTRTGNQSNTNGLIAYYQFNEMGNSQITDKVSINHASLSGSAKKVISTAPVGGGSSDRIIISSSNNYVLPNTGTEIRFGATTPGKEVVVTRIDIAPDSLPNSNPHSNAYWILNNYGIRNFSSLTSLKLKPHFGIPFKNPNNSRLFIRGENEHLNNWSNSCRPDNYNGGKFNFSTTCAIQNAQQFFIQSLDTNAIVGQYLRNTVNLIACKKDSIFLNGSYQFASGIFIDTITVSKTVDSIISTSLTILKDTQVTDLRSSCDSLVWLDGNTYFSSNNSATYTTLNAEGCDSVITLNLSIRTDEWTDTVKSCTPFKWINGVTYSSSNDTAKAFFTNQLGCDSIVHLDLSINTNHFVDSITACSSYTWINNQTYFLSGDTSTVILTNSKGCDSTVTLALKINNVDKSVTQNGINLISNQLMANYQWLDCDDDYSVILGSTNKSFTAIKNGRYAVKVDSMNCIDTSDCFEIKGLGIGLNSINNGMVLFPNPTDGYVTLRLEEPRSRIKIIQLDASGRLVSTETFEQTDEVNFKVVGATGNYVIEVITGEKDNTRFSVIKN